MEEEQKAEEERLRYLQEHTEKAKSNKPSMPWNPITLRYDDGEDGERLRAEDERIRYRAAVRAQHLHQRNMAEPFNPITGAPVRTGEEAPPTGGDV